MKYEKINKNYTKIIISFIVIIIIGSVLVLNITKAKYKTIVSVPIVSGTIKYEGNADLNVIAMYKPKYEDQEGPISDWDILTEAPGKGYDIDESNTNCTIGGEDDTSNQIKISYDGTSVTVTGLTKPKTKCNIYFIKKPTASDIIVDNSNVIDETPDFNKTACSSCADNKSGLYKTEDDFGDSYYFRGTVNDNWVKFGNISISGASIWWRIIRINGDGSIRLIYAGTGATAPATTGSQTNALTNQPFNSNYTDNKYVGYQYDNTKRGHTSPSNAYTKLIEWFKTNLADEFADENEKIDASAGFCGDRSSSTTPTTTWQENMSESGGIGGGGTPQTYYGAYLRLSNNNKQPTLKCSTNGHKDEDYYTYTGATGIQSISNEKIIGTQSLAYPIGLITADEVAFAGGVNNNSGYWLYTGSDYWTMSPSWFSSTDAIIFYVTSNGLFTWGSPYDDYGLRPVINLKANTELTFLHPDQTNKGTSTNPYIVS